jgi:hypothetical protein
MVREEMKINRFILPDEDPFLFPVRPIVENSFKIIMWLGIAATFQIAATVTRSWYLWGVCGLAYLLILFYLQSFIDWIWKIRSDRSPVKVTQGKRSAGTFLRRVMGTVIWLALGAGMQNVITNAIAAIVEFQSRGLNH